MKDLCKKYQIYQVEASKNQTLAKFLLDQEEYLALKPVTIIFFLLFS